MDRSSRWLNLALVFSVGAFFHQASHAAVNCTTGGVSYFGSEVYAEPQTPNGSGQYLYKIAGLQCSGGKVIKWTETSAWYTPDVMLDTLKASSTNMKRVFPNTCKTHAVLLHDNFTGSVDGVAASSYAVAKQTHFEVFAGPVFYDRSAELVCPETPGLGNPDLPGSCPVQSAQQVLASPATPSMEQGDPVNVSNGNSYQVEIDYPGQPGTQMRFARYYNSKTANWTHSYSTKLKLSPSKAMLINTDGRESLFTISGGIASASPKELGRLEQTASGWRYDNTYNEHLHFNTEGQLTRIDRANGSYETLTYGTHNIVVTDSLGLTMTLAFNTAKRLTGVATGTLQVAYTYSTVGRVTKVTRTQGGQSLSRTYHYEDTREGGWLTGITDERNIRYVTWAYDAQGRVIRNELNGVQSKYLFTYNSNVSTTVTNPLGKQSTYTFQTIAGAKRITALTGAASPNCPSSNSTFTYDSRGLIKTRTDNKGYVTTYDYNDRGLEVRRTEATGTVQARTITTEWHPTLYLPVSITEPGRVMHFEYDSQGNQLSQTITAL
ncbi:RHS Repeat protein [compost metagenome]